MFLFKKKINTHLGIDISASAIKIVEIKKEEERNELINYAIFSLEKYLKTKKKESDAEDLKISNEEIAEMIKKTIIKAKIKSKDTYFSVPVYSSFYTLIDFSDMTEKEIKTAIPFEAKKYIPIPITEVILDWSIVSSSSSGGKKQVLLIAVPKKIINDYNEIAKLAGLNLKGIEGETFSLSRSLIGNDKSVIILIDSGARSINVSIIDDGFIRVTHNLEMGGNKITKSIVQHMNIDSEKAEYLKKRLADKDKSFELNPQLEEIVQFSLGAIIIEIKKIIDSYQNKYSRKIEKGILAGGGIHLSGFVDDLSNRLSLDSSIGNPFARVSYPDSLGPVLKKISSSLAVAVGLAMREE